MKTAIVLFNLGGPDRPEAIKPFRVNLFSDKAIIRAPWFIRVWLSRLIARSSAKAAYENYQLMGGRSPLLGLTEQQARALEGALGDEYRCFIAMRYWHPFAAETVRQVKAWVPDRVLLLPLYPQFSTTTSGSSLSDWREAAAKAGLITPVTTLCCWFDDPAYIEATALMVREAIETARAQRPDLKLRVLYSAHGLPESIVKAGDPYQAQVEATSAAVGARLADMGVEYLVCYQSRATPQKWLEPSTIQAIEQAGRDGVGLVVVPIAFVSDHIETLVELDIENRHLAEENKVPLYVRARVANDDPAFIAALAGLVKRAGETGLCKEGGRCGAAHKDCPWERQRAS
ncbi:ferrochelatase [Acidocella facilis]|uniref:ferrochelatase n=1 Tax=Acidocella facilis TaxID=525 RepID=UPI001F15E5EE|nr:ferrochelatase [Acidocella facilis]